MSQWFMSLGEHREPHDEWHGSTGPIYPRGKENKPDRKRFVCVVDAPDKGSAQLKIDRKKYFVISCSPLKNGIVYTP